MLHGCAARRPGCRCAQAAFRARAAAGGGGKARLVVASSQVVKMKANMADAAYVVTRARTATWRFDMRMCLRARLCRCCTATCPHPGCLTRSVSARCRCGDPGCQAFAAPCRASLRLRMRISNAVRWFVPTACSELPPMQQPLWSRFNALTLFRACRRWRGRAWRRRL